MARFGRGFPIPRRYQAALTAGGPVQVSDADTASSIDAGESLHVTLSDADIGSGSESVVSIKPSTQADTGSGNDASVSIKLSSSDTGSGNDAGESLHVTLSSTDAGSGNDASVSIKLSSSDTAIGIDAGENVNTGSSVNKNDADTGSGADASASIGVRDGDTTNAVESILVSDNDSSSGDDELVATPDVIDVDAGAGTDASIKISLSDSDVCLAVELLSWTIGVTSTETGTGTEAQAVAVGKNDADTSTAIDAGSITSATQHDADSATGTDAGNVNNQTIHDADTASSLDATSHVTATLSSNDSANGLDASTSITITSTDAGSAAEANSNIHLSDADQAHSTENGSQGINKFDNDAASAVDTGSLSSATLSSNDAAHATERQDTEAPSRTYFNVEAFSFSHAAILNPGTGLESATLYAVRSATVTPTFDSYSITADDIDIAAWYNLTSASVQVQNGYIAWPAITAALGTQVQGPDVNGRTALSLWSQYMASLPEVPVILSTTARDLHFAPELSWHDVAGGTRSFTIVLYKVRLTGFSIDAFAYKQGITFSYNGIATLSSHDEAGNPLPGSYYSNGHGLSIGRMVSTPGTSLAQGQTPALALFGAGT